MSSILLAAPMESAQAVEGKKIVQVKNVTDDDIVEAPLLNVPEENNYAIELERALFQKNELIVDFSSLKTCIDPLREPAENSSGNDQEVKATTYLL